MRLPERWTKLKHHPVQQAYWRSSARFNCCSAGRRGGKSELAKRKLVKAAHLCTIPGGRFIYAAPTRDQAKRIAWDDLKALCVPDMIDRVLESELRIYLRNGAHLQVVGMDRPERVEGDPIDGAIVDEFGDMKPNAYSASIRPALSTVGRFGWCDFIGKPRGRNHWYRLVRQAQENPDWAHFTWKSVDIIGEEEVESAKAEIDLQTYMQEYEGQFLEPEGRAYHEFTDENIRAAEYRHDLPLKFAFDFNIEPGVATVSQDYDGATWVIDEVWVPVASNTKRVAKELLKRWGQHMGSVYLYGDATGGARGTAKIAGSDWTILQEEFRHDNRWSGVHMRVPKSNPPQIARINAVNSRLCTATGVRHVYVDPKCKHLIQDLRDVTRDDDGGIDKKGDRMLTHISDGFGYQLTYDYPTDRGTFVRQRI